MVGTPAHSLDQFLRHFDHVFILRKLTTVVSRVEMEMINFDSSTTNIPIPTNNDNLKRLIEMTETDQPSLCLERLNNIVR